jgi:hypothetical protein
MMKLLIALILLAVFSVFALSAYAQSQPPSPRPPEISQPKQERSEANKTSFKTKQNLKKKESIPDIFPVKSLAQEKQEKPESDRSKVNEKAPTDWGLVVYTAILAVFTGVLAVVGVLQFLILRRQNRYFVRIERAYIFVEVDANEDAISHSPPSLIAVTIRNLGKTPAILIKLQVRIDRKSIVYPTLKNVDALNNIIAQGTFIQSGQWETRHLQYSLTAEEWAKIKQGETGLICYGCIEYKDVFHITHKTGFSWETSPFEVDPTITNPNLFAMSHNKELNYYT